MATPSDRARRPARGSRWAATGLTAAVTVGAVAAMAESAPDGGADHDEGVAIGAVARYRGEIAAAALMAAADPGLDVTMPDPPPRLGRAGVS